VRVVARAVATTVDLLGEAVLGEAEADAYVARNLEALEALAGAAAATPACASDLGPGGHPVPRVNLARARGRRAGAPGLGAGGASACG
jgi:RHH-type proline utilization regulon transcriptional repressor/proline dehydrogenase/delta 1-pyrroline-5-carboxylate dehydrogenase